MVRWYHYDFVSGKVTLNQKQNFETPCGVNSVTNM